MKGQNLSTMDLIGAARQLVEELEYRGGVLGEDMDAILDEFLRLLPDKVGAIRYVIDRVALERDYLKAEEARLADRRRSWDARLAKIKVKATALMHAHQEVTGERKIKAADYTAWLATTTSVHGPELATAWPHRFLSEEVVVRVDKKAAKAALQAGEEFDGLTLVERDGVRFR
jgi:hypothetical protein